MKNNEQQLTTMDSNGQQWTAMDNNGQQCTTMDENIRCATCTSNAIFPMMANPKPDISYT